MDPSVPLIVAGVNDAAVEAHRGIIANPNCTTMTVMMAAGPCIGPPAFEAWWPPHQSVSGSGPGRVVELVEQTDFFRPDLDALTGGWRIQDNALRQADQLQRPAIGRVTRRTGVHRRGVEAGQ